MIGVVALALLGFFWLQNNALQITEITVAHRMVPPDFAGFRILQVSDLHNKSFGPGQQWLMKAVRQIKPDLIVITGDLIDGSRTDIDQAMVFVEQMTALAPVYFVSGNHEAWSGVYGLLQGRLEGAGVTILDDQMVDIVQGTDRIHLSGLADPAVIPGRTAKQRLEALQNRNNEGFGILLSHRPELFPVYVEAGIDLVLAGHAHGGQFRLPLIGGLVAPGQGIFPQYTAGLYREGETQMVVSRGLGNSLFPLRLMNRPQLVVLILEPFREAI